MALGMMISAIKISVRDDRGLFKDELEIRGGKVPPFDKVLSGSKLSWSLCDVLDIGRHMLETATRHSPTSFYCKQCSVF